MSFAQPAEAAALIRSVCDEGYRRWEQCLSLGQGADENLVIVQTHYHILEQLDAVQVLVAAGAVEPSKLQLRAAFEALLTLEYILQSDTRRRAYAWLVVADILERIKSWDRSDDSSEVGKAFRALLSAEGQTLPQLLASPGEKKRSLQTMLENDPRWTEAYSEYQRVKGSLKKRRPDWYELFGGPLGPGLRNLAVYLRQGTPYEVIYRLWSRRMHGTDVVQRVRAGRKDRTMAVEPRRYAADVNTVLNYAVTFGLRSTRLLVNYYCPTESAVLSQWYSANVRSKWPSVAGPPPV